jgi:hypothetical protein
VLVSLTRTFLPFHERYLRQAGHVHYNEIMLAMLYWYSVRVWRFVVLFQDAMMVSKQNSESELPNWNARVSRNKEKNIVPQKQQEARKDRDDLIKFEVAFQIISALIRGAIARRRRYDGYKDRFKIAMSLDPCIMRLWMTLHAFAGELCCNRRVKSGSAQMPNCSAAFRWKHHFRKNIAIKFGVRSWGMNKTL